VTATSTRPRDSLSPGGSLAHHATLPALCLTLALLPGCERGGRLPVVLQLGVHHNPNSVLSCFVRWQTAVPASSEVEFGESTDYEFVVGDPAAQVTDHTVLVVGLKPARTYHMQAVSRTLDGKEVRSDDFLFETGPLPFGDFATELRVDEPTLRRPGWTLTSLKSSGAHMGVNAVLIDGDGDVVWYFLESGYGEGWAMESHVVDNGHVTLGGAHPTGWTPVEIDRGGGVAWKGPIQPDVATPGAMHHTFRQLGDGTYTSLIFGYEDGHLHDEIWEFDGDGQTTFTWSSRDHLFANEDDSGKWCNALDHDLGAGIVYLNCNRDDHLFAIDRATGAVLWTLGPEGDFAPDPDATHPWVQGAHAPEVQPDGHVLLLDNGGAGRPYSRLVEYELDTEGKTSRIAWEYPGQLADDVWFNSVWGDADRLANGNTLATVGSMLSDESPSRIFEVTADGRMAWELYLVSASGDEETRYGAYRAERVQPWLRFLGR
jgi:hypothetical protein